MTEAAVYLAQIKAMSAFLTNQVSEVPDKMLYRRPGPSLNPVVWNYWHLLRVWDLDLNWLIKGQQPTQDLWHRGGFAAESGYDPAGLGTRGMGIGTGYTDAQVDALRVPRDVLASYQAALLAETEEYLSSADEAELHREVPLPADPSQQTTPAVRLQHTISHSYGHIGELRYTKGMLGFPDRTYPRS